MNDYTLPMMQAIECIRSAEASVEDNRLDLAEQAVVAARYQLSDALVALIDEQSDRKLVGR